MLVFRRELSPGVAARFNRLQKAFGQGLRTPACRKGLGHRLHDPLTHQHIAHGHEVFVNDMASPRPGVRARAHIGFPRAPHDAHLAVIKVGICLLHRRLDLRHGQTGVQCPRPRNGGVLIAIGLHHDDIARI